MSRSGGSGTTVVPVEGRELRDWVEERLGEGRLLSLERRPLAATTSFACERLTVRTPRATHRLFFKDFGQCRLPRTSKDAARRELWAYRELLAPAELGTARHVASLERGDGGAWLLLEDVEGSRLDDLEPRAWMPAARWLARLQAVDPPSGTAGAGPLVVHDVGHFLATAEEAVRVTNGVDPRLANVLREAIDGYEALVFEFDRQPRRLVHGSFRPQNLLLAPAASGDEPARLVAVDWEHVALGSVLYDVTFLANGLEPRHEAALLRAYRRAAGELGVPVPGPTAARRTRKALLLHKVLRSLCRSRSWGYSLDTVTRLVDQARDHAREVLGKPASKGVARVYPASKGHPSLAAWRRLGRDDFVPREVQALKGRYFGYGGRDRVVYRLTSAGPRDGTLVAKCHGRETGAFEHRVYTELLPRLAVPTPRAHGLVEVGDRSWLFLEDAGRETVDLANPAHVAASRAWLAAFHEAGSRLDPPDWLPDRGTEAHRRILLDATSDVRRAVSRSGLRSEQVDGLERLLVLLERTALGWETFACHASPPTLVHGDFRRQNLFVRPTPRGPVVTPIDWEYAGWGPPEVDRGALEARVTTDPEHTPAILCGIVLRLVSAVGWATLSLETFYPDKGIAFLGSYERRLAGVLDELGVAS